MGREDYKRRGKVIERDWDESFVAPMSATVPAEMGGLRLDQALARLFHQYSRNRLQAWLQEGHITIDGKRLSSRHAVTGGESVVLTPPQVAGASPRAQRMPLKIAYEDADLIVIDKPVGLVVHPGAGQPDRTLMNGLLAHAPALAGVPRAGIVHRLDKDTSGLLVVAKTVEAQTSLVEQLASRSMKRTYLALVQGDPPAGIRAPARAWRSRTAARNRAPRIAWWSASAARRWSNAGSILDAPTRSGCTSSTSAIPWSATPSTGAARATASIFRARRCTPRNCRWCIRAPSRP
jgi:16S rRNA U516 pseudouridylate synthase RsuA-like enzyme